MHEAETRALRRAATVLLVVSAARWAWDSRAPRSGPPGTVLPGLLADSREAADEASRRSVPLGDDQRLDANRATEIDLDRLPGVGPATARAIVEARNGGAVFRRTEDLLVVRGIGASTLARIEPHLHVRNPPAARGRPGGASGDTRVDVNRADGARLEALPGIGPAIAERIVAARRERRFGSVDDLERVRGIGPATVERLRPLVTVGPGR